jgi:hypothetical protein
MYQQLPFRRTALDSGLRRLYSVRLVKEPLSGLSTAAPKKVRIQGPRDVFQFMQPFAEQEASESFWALPLDTQHQCKAPHTITRGILNASLVHPREVFRAMIMETRPQLSSVTITQAETQLHRLTIAASQVSLWLQAVCSTFQFTTTSSWAKGDS